MDLQSLFEQTFERQFAFTNEAHLRPARLADGTWAWVVAEFEGDGFLAGSVVNLRETANTKEGLIDSEDLLVLGIIATPGEDMVLVRREVYDDGYWETVMGHCQESDKTHELLAAANQVAVGEQSGYTYLLRPAGTVL